MATQQHQGAAPAAPTFDAANWFASWADNGGIAIATDDRLFLSRSHCIDREARGALDILRNEIVRDRSHGEALAAYLVARSFGEARP